MRPLLSHLLADVPPPEPPAASPRGLVLLGLAVLAGIFLAVVLRRRSRGG